MTAVRASLLSPEETVREFLAAMERRDLAVAAGFLAPEFSMVFPGGAQFSRLEDLVAWSRQRYRRVGKVFERVDTAASLDCAVVYCSGTLQGEWLDGRPFSGIRFIDRFQVRGGLLLSQAVWNDMAEARLVLTPLASDSAAL